MDHGEKTKKLVPGYDIVMELEQRKQDMKDVEKRMKKFIGEKNIEDLNLRELIEFEKRIETARKRVGKIPVGNMTEEAKDVIIMSAYVKNRIDNLEAKILKSDQDEFDIIMEAKEGLRMRMKVFIEEKEFEDLHMEELIEFKINLETLLPKSVENIHMEDMRELKDIIIMKEIVKRMIAKKEPSSSETMIIQNYFN